ncbi:MAG: four helix bundle protein [Bacteroidota bacterium]
MEYLSEKLKQRTKELALRIIRTLRALPKSDEARVIGRQLLRSATSVAANYRAVCRSRSRAEFISKIGTVVEETDETVFWLEMLLDTEQLRTDEVQSLLVEANELLAIFCCLPTLG